MTEQEKREKEICVTKEDFERSEIIHQTIGCSYKCYECRRYNKECKDYAIVKQLKSYYERKEEEVRKETASEIRDMLLERLDEQENMLLRFELAAMITKIETIFGVEVEE